MDPFRFCLALGPVTIYLFLLGAMNLMRRPFLVAGTRDSLAFGLAVSGLAIVGPIELFFPVAASILFAYGFMVWPLLVGLYAMCLVLVLLLLRPRLVIYNITTEQLRPVLAGQATQLDPDARWAGDSLSLPNLGVQLRMETFAAMRNVSLLSNGSAQNYQSWYQLETALTGALAELEVPRNRRAVSLLSAGTLLAIIQVVLIARDPRAIAQAMLDMFLV